MIYYYMIYWFTINTVITNFNVVITSVVTSEAMKTFSSVIKL